MKIFEKYTVCLWAIAILLIVSVTLVPFIPGYLFGRIPATPVLVFIPILMGIIYALIVSYETPKMDPKRKKLFTRLKTIDIFVFYILTIVVVVFAGVKGMIRF